MELSIPRYQRPYKWTTKNITDLMDDIDVAIIEAKRHRAEKDGDKFRYRIGTIILHEENGKFNIVDGQQRILSFILLQLALDDSFKCALLNKPFDKTSQANIYGNNRLIRERLALSDKDAIRNAFDTLLEVVVINVDEVVEAFQLFDSQNTRGKELDPPDLLKAYHLREMKEYPYDMQHAVIKWEAEVKSIKGLFEDYLYPIRQWMMYDKNIYFSVQDIDVYKGITENSAYTYAKRASKATPYFQIAEPFIAGNDFFEMTAHYLKLLRDIKNEVAENVDFIEIKKTLDKERNNSIGFGYAENLFFCVLLCYYDKFRNFNVQVVKKLFSWAFMLRVDMTNLGYDSISKYAIGEKNDKYSNQIALFAKINNARLHKEIASIPINVLRDHDKPDSEKWNGLYRALKKINGLAGGRRSK